MGDEEEVSRSPENLVLPAEIAPHVRILRLAQDHPDQIAVTSNDQSVSYGDLAARVGVLVNGLTSSGVGAGSVVGVCLPRSPDAIVALLAIHTAGGVYLPLDPRYPPERRLFMLEDAAATVLVTTESMGPEITGPRQAVLVDDLAPPGSASPLELIPEPPAADELAYIMYTSGSTGRPKGVMVEHGSLACFVDWGVSAFTAEELSRVLASSSVGFDISLFELLVPLVVGGRVVMVENLLRLMDETHMVTMINTVPSLMSAFLARSLIPEEVRTVCLAGERLSPELVKHVYDGGQVRRVVNAYGPTESTIYATVAEVHPNGQPPIGWPIPGTEAHVLDARGHHVEPGEEGELYLAGRGLARGYRGLEALTAERFVHLAVCDGAGTRRMYRTGDLVRRDESGALHYLGRIDDQLKVRGVRVEPGEIESALRLHPSVRDAAVALRQAALGSTQLAAYIVPEADAPTSDDLRRFLGRTLPEQMIPSSYQSIAELPLTPNGKLDRAQLSSSAVSVRDQRVNATHELSLREQALARIWAEVLELAEPPGPDDNFFDLGGDSLLAEVLLAAIDEDLGYNLPPGVLVESPTLGGLARRIDAAHPQDPRLLILQAQSDRPPCVYLHGGAGGLLSLRSFAPAAGPDQEFIAIQAYVQGGPVPPPAVPEAAAQCLELLQSQKPTGPYILLGHSIGAHVAFEMACQLTKRNEEIAFLGLLDPTAPETLRIGGRLRARLKELTGRSEAARSWSSLFRALRSRATHDGHSTAAEQLGLNRAADDLAWTRQLLAVERSYHPPKYTGEATVFFTRPTARYAGTRTLGWHRHVTGELETVMVPGNHTSMLREPHSQALAHEVAVRIRRVRTTS